MIVGAEIMGKEYQGFKILGPESMSELAAALKEFDGDPVFLAGGTDLLIELKNGRKSPELVVDLSGIGELVGVRKQPGSGFLSIGSMTTFNRLAREPLVLEHAFCLAQAAGRVGSQQIRNRGTLGGNIASASPAGDSLPGLLVLAAQVSLLSSTGQRKIPLSEVLRGKGRTCLAPRELITGIEIPLRDKSFRSGFVKIGSRSEVSIARLSMAAALNYDSGTRVSKDVRVAVGALGETAFRLPAAEQALEGKGLNRSLLEHWQEIMIETVDKAIPGRASQPYKREAVKGLVENLAFNLWDKKLGQRAEWGGNANE